MANTDAQQRPPILRNISVGINVDDPAALPKLGDQLAKLLRKVDVEHGPFDVTIGITVGGFENAKTASTVINNFYGDDVDFDGEETV